MLMDYHAAHSSVFAHHFHNLSKCHLPATAPTSSNVPSHFFSCVPPHLPNAQAYYIYGTNEEWIDQSITLDLSQIGATPGSNIVISAVGPNPPLLSSFHGEVSQIPQLPVNQTLQFPFPSASVFMFTVPKVPTQRLASDAVADTTVPAAGGSSGSEPTLQVSTADAVSVALLKFNIDGQVGDQGIVSAVLQLHLESATNTVPQVCMVLGVDSNWGEGVTWGQLNELLPVNGPVTSTANNFINWVSNPNPSVIGHVTVPPGSSVPSEGVMLQLDVTDAVNAGQRDFLVVRMFRFDASTGQPPAQLPADPVQGTYTFSSREASNPDNHPKLLVDFQVPPQPPPPPAASPPPLGVPPPPYQIPPGYQYQPPSPGDYNNYEYTSPPYPPPPRVHKPPPRRPPPKATKPPPSIKKRSPPGRKKRPPPPKKSGGKKKPPPPKAKKSPPAKRSPPPKAKTG